MNRRKRSVAFYYWIAQTRTSRQRKSYQTDLVIPSLSQMPTEKKKINEWPKIFPNDGASLRKFSDFLIHCQTATKTIKYLKVLDDPDETRTKEWSANSLATSSIVGVAKWAAGLMRTKKINITVKDSCLAILPAFSAFCRFLQRESRIACNPVTTVRPQKKEVVKEERKSNGFSRRKPPKFNALATDSHEVADSNAGNNRKEKKTEA